jgi:hypothetical protein
MQIWLGGAHLELLAGNEESARALIDRCLDEVRSYLRRA